MIADHWYLLPVGFGIAVLAMSSGISAGNFWVPVYLLWARFEPLVAFWMTLVTMLCGYGSCVVRLNGPFLAGLSEQRATLLGAMAFAGPGVILGGQLGPMMARRMNVRTLRWYVSVILLLVGTLMLVRFAALIVCSR